MSSRAVVLAAGGLMCALLLAASTRVAADDLGAFALRSDRSDDPFLIQALAGRGFQHTGSHLRRCRATRRSVRRGHHRLPPGKECRGGESPCRDPPSHDSPGPVRRGPWRGRIRSAVAANAGVLDTMISRIDRWTDPQLKSSPRAPVSFPARIRGPARAPDGRIGPCRSPGIGGRTDHIPGDGPCHGLSGGRGEDEVPGLLRAVRGHRPAFTGEGSRGQGAFRRAIARVGLTGNDASWTRIVISGRFRACEVVSRSFSTRAHSGYAAEVVKALHAYPRLAAGVEGSDIDGELSISRFADGEMEAEIGTSVRGCDVFLFAGGGANSLGIGVEENKIETYHAVDALRRRAGGTHHRLRAVLQPGQVRQADPQELRRPLAAFQGPASASASITTSPSSCTRTSRRPSSTLPSARWMIFPPIPC